MLACLAAHRAKSGTRRQRNASATQCTRAATPPWRLARCQQLYKHMYILDIQTSTSMLSSETTLHVLCVHLLTCLNKATKNRNSYVQMVCKTLPFYVWTQTHDDHGGSFVGPTRRPFTTVCPSLALLASIHRTRHALDPSA